MKSIITVSGVSFELQNGRILFENISFSLSSKRTALVGPNGIGKTCLAKILVGDILPTKGTVRINKAATYIQQTETAPAITVESYLLPSYSWSVLGEKLLSGINRTTLCSNLSGGQWMRVRLAAKIENQFLILDEPSNNLDQEAKSILRNFLEEYKSGIFLISHDREILELCEDVLELSNQGLAKYGGGWSSYQKEKERERSQGLNELSKAQRERDKAKAERNIRINKQEKRNQQGRAFANKTGMSKIEIGAKKRQAQTTTGKTNVSTLEAANAKVKKAFEIYSEIKIDPVMYIELSGVEIPSNKLIAEAINYNIFLDRWLYQKDLNFSWKGNVRLAIKGSNGSGKTTLVKSIIGHSSNKTKGELRVGKLKTFYLDQNHSNIIEKLNIFENVRSISKMSDSEIRNSLAKLLFTGDSVFQQVESLSGGERLRVALACGLLAAEKPELIILDEPTNNLDLANIQFLENLISQFKGAVIIISHDEVFLSNCGIQTELLL